jgi:DnaJ domain
VAKRTSQQQQEPETEEPQADLYAELGVGRDATHEEIEKAYRSLAQKWHPDRAGGNGRRFVRVGKAWRILGDAGMRAVYDTTGDSTQEKPIEEEVLRELRMLARQTLRILPMGHSLVDCMRVQIEGKKQEFRAKLDRLKDHLKRVKWHREQLKSKKPPPNILDTVYQEEIELLHDRIATGKRLVMVGDQMLEALDDFESGPPALTFGGPIGPGMYFFTG